MFILKLFMLGGKRSRWNEAFIVTGQYRDDRKLSEREGDGIGNVLEPVFWRFDLPAQIVLPPIKKIGSTNL